MDVDQFLHERTQRWERLATLLDKAEQSPERELGPDGMRELLRLYRLTSSDLNQARSLTADPEILERLNALAGRGYRFIYRRRRGGELPRRAGAFLSREVPEAFQRHGLAVAAAIGAILLGALFGAAAVLVRPQAAEDLIPGEFFTQSPRERVQEIEQNDERIANVEDAAMFSSELYTHNIQVSFLAFSLGALTIAGGLWILFYNGIILGAVAASYFLDGVTVFFLAWVGPHGALELPAIALAGAAGLAAGRALLLPGQLSRGASVRRVFPHVWRMMVGIMAILVVAGLIEGSFSQFSAKTVPYALKISLAVILHAGLLVWLFLPRQRSGEDVP